MLFVHEFHLKNENNSTIQQFNYIILLFSVFLSTMAIEFVIATVATDFYLCFTTHNCSMQSGKFMAFLFHLSKYTCFEYVACVGEDNYMAKNIS